MRNRKMGLAALPLLTLLSSPIGCSDNDKAGQDKQADPSHEHGEECGGHGELHGDHCDCDSGYETASDDETSCVASSEGGENQGGSKGQAPVTGAGGAGADVVDPCDFEGNIGTDELPATGSVGFVIHDGRYRFVKQPSMEDTSVTFISENCDYAYGWSRDKPWNDVSALESSWKLNIETMEFTTLEIPGTVRSVLRGALEDGRVVGKAWIEDGTSHGFIYNVETDEVELVVREGFGDIGFTSINSNGLVVGFNDFGTQGFVFDDGTFHDLNHDDAYRLFPFQVNSHGTIVGFWGLSEDSWYDNSVNPAFVARPSGDTCLPELFELEGQNSTGLTGLNESGAIAGLAYASATSLPVVFSAESVDDAPTFYPLGSDVEPFPTGISETGLVHGQTFILAEPPPCGGHGTPDGDTCVCDENYEIDPYDAANCLAPGAECSGHGHLHGDECHCDAGFKKSSTDASMCVPS